MHSLALEESQGAKHTPCASRTVKINHASNIRETQALYVTVHGEMQSHNEFAVTGVPPVHASSRAYICRSNLCCPPQHKYFN